MELVVGHSQNRVYLAMGRTLATRLKQNDRRPVFSATLFDPDGDPADLTGVVGVAFRMREKMSRAVKIDDAAMTIVSATDGTVSYAWTAADTDTAGDFEAWVVVEWSSGVEESYPNAGSHQVLIEP